MDEPGHHLPGVITSITPQKKNKERYSIFVNDVFLIGVDGSTLLDHDLRKGVEITPSFFRRLQRDEGRNKVKSYMLKLLSRRDHARQELLTKAQRKDYPVDVINDVLDELERKDFINEKSFALKFTHDKSHLNRWGPYKIKAHLAQKGISKSISEQAVNQTFQQVDFKERFKELVYKHRRKFLREGDPFKRKKKVFDYLQRKGYSPHSIYNYLDDLVTTLEDE